MFKFTGLLAAHAPTDVSFYWGGTDCQLKRLYR